jgi:hypothetical protein
MIIDVGATPEFFGNGSMMDYELMDGDTRDAIVAEARKRGMTPFLPPLVPFGSKQWPTFHPRPRPRFSRSASVTASRERSQSHCQFDCAARAEPDGRASRVLLSGSQLFLSTLFLST